jgi:hypothetical protein
MMLNNHDLVRQISHVKDEHMLARLCDRIDAKHYDRLEAAACYGGVGGAPIGKAI